MPGLEARADSCPFVLFGPVQPLPWCLVFFLLSLCFQQWVLVPKEVGQLSLSAGSVAQPVPHTLQFEGGESR